MPKSVVALAVAAEGEAEEVVEVAPPADAAVELLAVAAAAMAAHSEHPLLLLLRRVGKEGELMVGVELLLENH